MRIVVQGMEENRRRKGGIPAMADRKQFLGNIKADPELKKILETSRQTQVTEEELQEQRISFAFGNVPASAKNITKDSVRQTSKKLRLLT
jgi:hypothetical protein